MAYNKEAAIIDLLALQGRLLSFNWLAKRWGWPSHSKVHRLLSELERKNVIKKNSDNNGTTIFFVQPEVTKTLIMRG